MHCLILNTQELYGSCRYDLQFTDKEMALLLRVSFQLNSSLRVPGGHIGSLKLAMVLPWKFRLQNLQMLPIRA